MSKRIGIIGAGTAGLQLGLFLRQHGIEATIYTDRRPEEYAAGRLPNTVAHHAVTVEREKAASTPTSTALTSATRCTARPSTASPR